MTDMISGLRKYLAITCTVIGLLSYILRVTKRILSNHDGHGENNLNLK